MSVQELEAEALKLSAPQRAELIRRLLTRLDGDEALDPLLRLGTEPVTCGASDASAHHDRYLYGTAD